MGTSSGEVETMKLFQRKSPSPVRTWNVAEALWAHCTTCDRWLDDRHETLRRAVLVHKCDTGHVPQLYKAV